MRPNNYRRSTWLNTLSIEADDVSFHSTIRRPAANVRHASGSWFLFCLFMKFDTMFLGSNPDTLTSEARKKDTK